MDNDDGGGAIELPTFFLPFDPPPTLAPDSESIVTLKYWLEPRPGKPNPPLTLKIDGESFLMKPTEESYQIFSVGYQF